MSRIDEALRRALFGPSDDPRRPLARAPEADRSVLKRYHQESETVSKLEEGPVSGFAFGDPVAEGTPSAPQQASVLPQGGEQPEAPLESEAALSSEKLVDLRQVADYSRFVAGSLRRHKLLAAGAFSLVLAMTVAAAILLPKTYHTQVKLLAQRNEVMAALSNPGRAVPWDADAPTRAAAETVLRRDNLISLMEQTDLMNEWERTRVPILKVKDWLMTVVLRRHTTPAEKLDQLLGLLEARMVVGAGPVGDGTVTIDLDWPNAQMAYRLVEAAQESFVKARQTAETATIGESIAILEGYATKLHEDINRTLVELQRAQAQIRPAVGTLRAAASAREPVVPSIASTLPPVPVAALGSPALGANLEDPQIPRLKATIASKRVEITNLEEARQKQLSDLQARLAQLSTIYTPTHPTVVGVQQNIAAVSQDTPQVAELKTQTETLEAEYEQRVAAAEELLQVEQVNAEMAKSASTVSSQEGPAPRTSPAPIESRNVSGSETTDFASVRFRLELNQLESVLERIDGARIELAVSQAAFKYRYTVIRPAEVPRAPVRPNLQAVVGAGLFGGLVLALAAVLAKDVLSNRILESWQIERQLGLPILGSPRNL